MCEHDKKDGITKLKYRLWPDEERVFRKKKPKPKKSKSNHKHIWLDILDEDYLQSFCGFKPYKRTCQVCGYTQPWHIYKV